MIQLNVWDVSGHPEFSKQREEFYQGMDALVFVFDYNFKDSFENLGFWVKEVRESGVLWPEHTYLVANKVKIE